MKRALTIFALTFAAAFGGEMETLLEKIKSGGERERQAEIARVDRFTKERNDIAALLKKTKAEYERLQAKGRELVAQSDANEKTLDALNTELKRKSGNLNELFGAFRQRIGEFKAETEDSIVSAQTPARSKAIAALSNQLVLPSAEDLERFWILQLEEIAFGGRIARFNADVVDRGGVKTNRVITRLGAFGAIAEGEYIVWKNGAARVSAGQPSASAQRAARSFENAKEPQAVAIDPTRGSLLELFSLSPSFYERMTQGGAIGYLILTLGAFGLAFGARRIAQLRSVGKSVERQLADINSPRKDNPLGRVLLDAKNAETTLDLELGALEKGQGAIKLLAAAAPLLGLLGTVVGMIGAFQAITLFGAGDPKMMAGSISLALVTTMQGLIVAVPLLFLHGYLRHISRTIGDRLESVRL